MTPEDLEFYKLFSQSPIVGTLAGGLLGILASFSATWFKSRHDSKESEKRWQREEERRKEERAFQNKNLAYEDFINHVGEGPVVTLLPRLAKIVLYGPKEVRKAAKTAIHEVADFVKFKDSSSQEAKNQRKKASESVRKLNDEIMKDIDQHFGR